jgi:predicted nucleotidyltransferase
MYAQAVTLLASEARAVEALRAWLRERFGGRLRELALFGSKARGEAHEDSDVDVLVVVDGLTSAETREIGHLGGDLLTHHDVLIATFAVSTERMTQLRSRDRRIAREIDRDAVPL